MVRCAPFTRRLVLVLYSIYAQRLHSGPPFLLCSRLFCRIDELGVGNRKFFSATAQDVAERDRTRVWKEVGLRGVGEL